ncbi:hypothetical protein OSTOST_25306 [Ostertagia ostertagi]
MALFCRKDRPRTRESVRPRRVSFCPSTPPKHAADRQCDRHCLRHLSRLLTADCVTLSRPLNQARFVHQETSPSPSMPKDFEDYAKRYFVFEQVEPDVFRTTNLITFRQGSSKAAYGGLIFAQALAAAENTVYESLKPHHAFIFILQR